MQANKPKSDVMVVHPMEGQSANVPAEQQSNTEILDGHNLLQVQSYESMGLEIYMPAKHLPI